MKTQARTYLTLVIMVFAMVANPVVAAPAGSGSARPVAASSGASWTVSAVDRASF